LSFSFLIFVFGIASSLEESNKKLSDDLEAMKATVLSEYNRAKEVTERVEEGLALARLIRHGADRDLVQAKKTRRSDWQAGDIHRELECFVAILSLGCRSSLNSSG
jgi:hypothetical protein